MLDIQKPNLSPTSHLSPTSPTMRKRQRTLDHVGNAPVEGHAIPLSGPAAVGDDAFITDRDAVESGAEEDDDDDGTKPKDKKAGRRKIKIEYIQDKSRRHITFSKRKAGMLFHKRLTTLLTCLFTGIMKKVTFIPDSYILFCLISLYRLTNCPLLRALKSSCSSYQRQGSSTLLPLQNSNPSSLNQRERISSKLVSMLLMVLYHHHSQSVTSSVGRRPQ